VNTVIEEINQICLYVCNSVKNTTRLTYKSFQVNVSSITTQKQELSVARWNNLADYSILALIKCLIRALVVPRYLEKQGVASQLTSSFAQYQVCRLAFTLFQHVL